MWALVGCVKIFCCCCFVWFFFSVLSFMWMDTRRSREKQSERERKREWNRKIYTSLLLNTLHLGTEPFSICAQEKKKWWVVAVALVLLLTLWFLSFLRCVWKMPPCSSIFRRFGSHHWLPTSFLLHFCNFLSSSISSFSFQAAHRWRWMTSFFSSSVVLANSIKLSIMCCSFLLGLPFSIFTK